MCHLMIIFKKKYPKIQKVDLTLSLQGYQILKIKKHKIMAVELILGKGTVTGTLGLIDHDTQQPVPGASFSNSNNTSDNTAVVTVDAGNVVTPVGVGEANVTFQSEVDYTDGHTGQPVKATKSIVETFTVVAPPPVPQVTNLIISFSAQA
jgi:hypothetical protein